MRAMILDGLKAAIMDSILHSGRTAWDKMIKLQTVEWIALCFGAGMMGAVAELPMPWQDRLAMLCGIGGLLGSAFFVCMNMPKSHFEALTIFLANSIAAYAWGPMVIDAISNYTHWEITSGRAMGLSATIGATATGALKPFIQKLWVKFATWIVGMSMGKLLARIFGWKVSDDESIHDVVE